MKPGLQHHYSENNHHPEFWGEDSWHKMGMLPMLEMLADWQVSSKGRIDWEKVKKRFSIPEDIFILLKNTAKDIFIDK
jgi:hypothetical protein